MNRTKADRSAALVRCVGSDQSNTSGATAPMRRTVGIVIGVGTHLLFAVTVWHLFWFLKGVPLNAARWSGVGTGSALVIDALLAGVLFVELDQKAPHGCEQLGLVAL